MLVYQCDKCRKTISDEKTSVTVGLGYFRGQLCAKCGKPIAQILKRYKLGEYEENAQEKNPRT